MDILDVDKARLRRKFGTFLGDCSILSNRGGFWWISTIFMCLLTISHALITPKFLDFLSSQLYFLRLQHFVIIIRLWVFSIDIFFDFKVQLYFFFCDSYYA